MNPISHPSVAVRRPDDPSDPDSLSTQFRKKRDVRLRELITHLHTGTRTFRILDMGGSIQYWKRVGIEFLQQHRVHVVVLNHLASELKEGVDDETLFTTHVGDACNLCDFSDFEFDLAHSNSVIEHVGNWDRMKMFGSETRRVGRSYYAQTPYYWFPIDPHYYRAPMIHWMPRPIQARLLTAFPICHAGKSANLDEAFQVLDGTQLIDRRQLQMAFPDGEIVFERLAGLTKSLIAIRKG